MELDDYRPDVPGDDDPGCGRRIAFDVGKARIGVASCDPDCILATPVETIHLKHYPWPQVTLQRIDSILTEYEPVEVIVGLPRTLHGRASSSVEMAIGFVDEFRTSWPKIPVRLVDERLSTVVATQALRSSQVASRAQRALVDQAAAVEILNTWLDLRRRHCCHNEKEQ